MNRLKDPRTFEIPEPRIPLIARHLERLLGLVELEYEGRPVRVDGFRLRRLKPWRSGCNRTAMQALTPISAVCNSRCEFCLDGQPIHTRIESEMVLQGHRQAGGRALAVSVVRDGEVLDFAIDTCPPAHATYPYDAAHYYRGENYGILHIEDFRLSVANQVAERAGAYGAKDVLLFSSPMVAPIFQAVAEHIAIIRESFDGMRIHLAEIEES